MATAFEKTANTQKRVLIGTPALDGRVDAWFAFALHQITKECSKKNIDVEIVLLSYESILPMARNEILSVAINRDFDSLFFIDSDVYCDPGAFIKCVLDEKDVIAIPTVKKSDTESYDIFINQNTELQGSWLKAERVSTSCLKLSKKALNALKKNSVKCLFRDKYIYNICQYDFTGEHFMGEDIYLCEKLKKLGFDVWVNIESTCMHVGPKVYRGDFKNQIQMLDLTQMD